ncbi:MAG: hypothetical protein LBH43_06715 [Treponema sp.]|jgi:hypothetical protein|nr:hypothetical protein [Treponema sp.]
MIAVEEDIFPLRENDLPDRLNLLKQKINDEDYLVEAIQRIAQVLSNEISGIPRKGKGERTR